MQAFAKALAMGLIRIYQLTIGPFLAPCCRFKPSCSEYAMEAIERFGVLRGLCLTTGRLLRCNPWGGSGFDPVPEKAHRHAHGNCRPSS